MRSLRFVVVATLTASIALTWGPSHASETPDVGGEATADGLLIEGLVDRTYKETPSFEQDEPNAASTSGASLTGTYMETMLQPVCAGSGTATTVAGTQDCSMARQCPDGGILATVFARQVRVTDARAEAGMWFRSSVECVSFDPENPPQAGTGPVPLPVVTWQMVLREVQRVGLPSLEVRVQPAGRTLVNFDTNFYAEPEAFERRLTLLGQGVEVRAEPVEFAWTFGDGTTDATNSPGAPYPDLEVTHAYTDADVTVEPSVDVTYSAQFRVGDGEWQEILETVTIGGSPVSLRVVEATPVLSGEGQYG